MKRVVAASLLGVTLAGCTGAPAGMEILAPTILDIAIDETLEAIEPGLSEHRTGIPESGLDYDPGGLMAERQMHVAYLLTTNIPFQVARECYSACPMILGAAKDPEVCFPRDGNLYFHNPRPIPGTGTTVDAAVAVLLAHIAVASPPLALKVGLELKELPEDAWIRVPMAQLVASGAVNAC